MGVQHHRGRCFAASLFALAGWASPVLAQQAESSRAMVSLVTEREGLAWEAARGVAQDEWFVQPRRAQHAIVDRAALEAALAAAPDVSAPRDTWARVQLPLPDGTARWFAVARNPIMEPALAAKFPQLLAFAGVCEDEPNITAWFELTNHGLRAAIRGHDEGFAYIDPVRAGSREHVMAYWLSDASTKAWDWHCATAHSGTDVAGSIPDDENGFSTRGSHTLRQYRIAMACTGEYGAYQSQVLGNAPNAADAMSAIVTVVNRSNATFEPDMGVRFVLIATNDQLAFFDAATDPYPTVSCDTPSSDCSFTIFNVNQGIIDGIVGNAAYDVGHVVTRLPGGVASLQSVCANSRKARGVSGIPRGGENEPVSALVVIHELGHQFGANHSYNGLLGRCGPNWAGSTAREPGGGSTQMSYPGACPVGGGLTGDNLVVYNDPYFHTGPLLEMRSFVSTGTPCAQIIDTSNTLPFIAGLSPTGLSIPPATPFVLTAIISDANGGQTFTWDQMDNGPQQTIEGPSSIDNGASPLFRSLPPIASATRVFPSWQSIFAGSDNRGERYARVSGSQRSFRITVRDNVPGGAGSVSSVPVRVRIADTQPFVVARPGGEIVRRASDGSATLVVSWSPGTFDGIAGTTLGDVLLTVDEGLSWQLIAESVPLAPGSATITVPSTVQGTSNSARVQVRPIGSLFFNVSAGFGLLPPCNSIDFNRDGLFPSDADLIDYLNVLAGGECSTQACDDLDFNRDGLFPDDSDLIAFLRVLAGGSC